MRLDTPDGRTINPSRRAIAASIFFSGYCAAALSAEAEPIHTPEEGLHIEDVHVHGAGGFSLPAYLARPAGRGRHPTIIVVNEIFGIHDYIKDTCRRLAHQGFVALAPAYFVRVADPAPLTDIAAIRPIVAAATYEQVMGDTQGAIDWLKAQSFTNGHFGITGFCWGGGIVWMAAARCRDLRAGVAWYGPLAHPQTPSATDPNRPYPVDIAAHLHAPVLGLYGGLDQGISAANVDAMRQALAANGNPTHSEIRVYPDAQHGFHADYRASYNALDAMDGWGRMRAWFESNGVV